MSEPVVISFGDTVRGGGKVFVDVRTSGREPANLVARAQVEGGGRTPAQLIHNADRSWVLVVPVVSAAQTVTVTALDEDDKSIAKATLTVKAFSARMRSSVNTLRRNEPALKIRNFDREHADRLPWFRIDRVVPAGDHEIVLGTLRLRAARRERDIFAKVDVEVLSPEGKSCGEPWICQGDTCARDKETHLWVREISFSVRIPAGMRSFVVACYRDTPTAPDGIHVREPHLLDADRRFFADLATRADTDPAYDWWFRRVHRASPRTLELQRACAQSLPEYPLFSIVVPLFHTPENFLRDMVDSVIAQTYDRWELVLVNASADDEKLRAVVDDVCERDSRIRLIELDENRGITLNNNAGIRAAKGDFVAFLDHDDTLEPDALYCYAAAIGDEPQTDMLYCDEDHLTGDRYEMPFFKPDWDLDRLCYENYVCHMLCVRASVLDDLGELPGPEFDGAQDHNLTLLVGERARHVSHVPRVLYHWRKHEGSTAQGGAEQKEGTLEAERLAIANHLERTGIAGTCTIGKRMPWRCDIDFAFDPEPLVSIVIPNKDGSDMLRALVESIFTKTTWTNYEIVIVENNSEEPETFALYRHLQKTDDRVRVVQQETDGSFNFSRTINVGFEAAQGEYLLMLNNDMELLTGDWLHKMVGMCQRPDVGVVGARLLYTNGCIQHIGVDAGRIYSPAHFNVFLPNDPGCNEFNEAPHRLLATTGACLMTKRSVFQAVGGMDEVLAVDYNDIDYCMRVCQLGLAVVVSPEVCLTHYESVTRGGRTTAAKRARFASNLGRYASRWGDYLACGDPWHSPNFKWGSLYFALDWNGNEVWPCAWTFAP